MDGVKVVEDAPCKQRDRRSIVTWTPQEDDLLRVQVGIHGTDNWPCIATQFVDKTSRQCRRRWYTYLNSECKKGGWSPEEDMILCEAQKVFGNRWTEIAKVVSGRTDNAVKNRFTTICKKRSKNEALSKENDRRVSFQNRCITDMATESSAPIKRIRYQISNRSDKRLITQSGKGEHLRPPLAVLVQNLNNMGSLLCDQFDGNSSKGMLDTVQNSRFQGSFLKKDDPKITALMQQAELLSSLALKVNTDGTDQSLENAWKELQDYLIRTGEKGLSSSKNSESNFLFNDFKDLIEDLRSSTTGSELLVRHPDLNEDSQSSSEYSTGSTSHSNDLDNEKDQHQSDECPMNHSDEVHGHREDEKNPNISTGLGLLSPCIEQKESDGSHISAFLDSEFSSPLQMIPSFRSFAEGIASPKFTTSEKRFLLSALGMLSPTLKPNPNQNLNPSRHPCCKRSLLPIL